MNTTKEVRIGDERLPSSLAAVVIGCMFDTKELREFWERYKMHRKIERATTPPTLKQRRIAQFVKEHKNRRAAALKFKVAPAVVTTALKKVAVYDYLGLE